MEKNNNAIKITLIISAVILIVSFGALYIFNSSMNSNGNTVNVNGVATIKAMPDIISVYFNIEAKGETTKEAKDENSRILNELIFELEKQGFDREEIITENFNIYPDYDWNDGERKENGFVARHNVKIEISMDESDRLNDIVDAGANAGSGVGSINFELSRELQNKYKAEAMKLAAEDAKIKADAVAEGFDKKVGKLVSTSVNNFGYSPWNLYSGAGYSEDFAMAKESVSNIQPGEKEITSSVVAVFKLK